MTLILLVLSVSLGQGVIDGSWDGFSETSVKRIHGPFELVFMPVPARGFALFTLQDIGQVVKSRISLLSTIETRPFRPYS